MILCVIQSALNVSVNLAYANILYMILPKDNETALIAFNTLGRNFLAFLGLLTGTYVSSLTGDTAIIWMGIQVYSVQYAMLMRAVILLVMGMILMRRWKAFTPDADIEQPELDAAARERLKKRKTADFTEKREEIERLWRNGCSVF